MIGIIWYDNFTNGQSQLEWVKRKYKSREINTIKELYSEKNKMIIVTFENGDVWHLKNAYALSCGVRCNVSYIESTIPRDVVMHVIQPCAYNSPYHKYEEHTF